MIYIAGSVCPPWKWHSIFTLTLTLSKCADPLTHSLWLHGTTPVQEVSGTECRVWLKCFRGGIPSIAYSGMPNVHTMASYLMPPASKDSNQHHCKSTLGNQKSNRKAQTPWCCSMSSPRWLWADLAKILPVAPANASSLESRVRDGLPCPPDRVGEFPFQWSLARADLG